jgi:hypothetical protein
MECRKIVYLFLPFFIAFAGGISYADVDVPAEVRKAAPTVAPKAAPTVAPVNMEALKAELKRELRAELAEEIKREIRAEMPREIAPAPAPEVPQSAIDSAVSKALDESGILSGLFKGTTVGGFIDVNYMYNLRNHGEGTKENATSKVNFIGENEDDSFTLENFALFLDKETTDEHPIGWQMHTYWGEKAKRITFLGEGAGRISDLNTDDDGTDDQQTGTDDTARNDIFTIATANITWDVPVAGRRVPVTMGKMYTWIGYELVENIGNPNYSHGIVYNNAIPFTHMGVSVDVSEFLPSDKFGLKFYYVNGWDSFIDNNEGKSWGLYTTWQPNDDFFISLAAIHGPDGWNKRSGVSTSDDFVSLNNGGDTMMYDIVATYSLPQVENLSLGFNWDHGYVEDFKAHDINGNSVIDTGASGEAPEGLSGAHWWAAVGYLMYDFTDTQQGALRYEYFDDTDGAKAFGGSIYSITYTQNMKIHENLLLRPEVRYNKYNIPSTPGADDPLAHGDKGNTADDEFIIGVGAEYVF